MLPHLDLSAIKHSYAHENMILSARKSPRMSLRPGSFLLTDRGQHSSTSSRFVFPHRNVSPPPSPGLPALVPRHGKKPPPTRLPRRWLRVLCAILAVLLFGYYASAKLQPRDRRRPVGWATNSGQEYEMVGESELPDFPTPVVVIDKHGRSKWTVSIPPDHDFPLAPAQYAEICQQNVEVANHVLDLHAHIHRQRPRRGYYDIDQNFMDVADAEAHGLLPGAKAKTNMNEEGGAVIGENTDSLIENTVCEKTMTFLLETSDAGLGKTLMMMWTAYGLAQKEGRHFFIDDARWAYGHFTDYFQQPPIPACRPPPRHEMLPCPRHARHLVVSAATAAYTFGDAFDEEFQDPKKMGVLRQEPIFALARAGYEALFNLTGKDDDYVRGRAGALQAHTMRPPPEDVNGTVIGIHVRHGDRHPYEFQYKDSYIPLEVYGEKAREAMRSVLGRSGKDGGENLMAERHTVFVVASDDPDVYDSEEFSHAQRAQEVIRLAAKRTDLSIEPLKVAIRKFVAENVGWEGGFFAAMFWSLGKTSSVNPSARQSPDTKLPPMEESLRLRQLVGRAYLMDLTVLGLASEQVICTLSSMGCRILAVMMGWERAIEQQKWINIDGHFDWKGMD